MRQCSIDIVVYMHYLREIKIIFSTNIFFDQKKLLKGVMMVRSAEKLYKSFLKFLSPDFFMKEFKFR